MSTTRPKQLQIFGERCSGTNYVAQLLRRNVPGLALTDRYGWKHGFVERVPEVAEDCVFVVVHRDPFDWVRSLHQKPWHAAEPLRGLSLTPFLREPWWCQWGRDMEIPADDPRRGAEMLHERDPASGERFANVLRLRTAKLRAWHSLAARVAHVRVVRYEDVLAEPRAFLRGFARQFGLFRWPWLRPVKTFKGGRDPFVPKQYEALVAPDLAWIASELDRDVERAAGYDLEACLARAAAGDSAAAT